MGLTGVLATGAIGYAVGSTFPSRFTAPVVAIGVFVAQALSDGVDTIRYLSAVQWGRAEVFYGVQQDLSLRQSLWMLSLTAAMLAAVVYHGRRTVFTQAALISAVAVTLVAASPLLLTARVSGAHLSWIVPMIFTVVVILIGAPGSADSAPWAWPVQPPTDTFALASAATLLAVGLTTAVLVGPRETRGEASLAT